MQITLTLNGIRVSEEIAPDMLLIDFVRAHGCKSVKRGCETSNCGLCTVFMDDEPVLSCSVLAARADGHKITTQMCIRDRWQPLKMPKRVCTPYSSTRRCCTPPRARRCCATLCTTSAAAPATGRWIPL